MRSVVFAYHDIGYVCLQELLRSGATVAAVLTHQDDGQEEIWFRPVRALAEERGLPVFAPDSVNTPEWIERIGSWQPDFLFSFYYRKILCREILNLAKHGAFNLHGSLLPKYRGRCPVNWVLIHDERETGVTLHYMEEKPDRGDIVAQRAVPINDDDTALTLFRKMTEAAALLMRESYPLLVSGHAPRRPQVQAQASYFGGRKPEDGRIDWSQPARAIFNLVRAVTHPYPGAFTSWQGRRLYVWEARPAPTAQPATAETVDKREPQGPPQGERKLSFENNNRTARPEEPPSSGGVSKPVLSPVEGGARWSKSTAGAAVGAVIATTPELLVQTRSEPLRLLRVQLEGEPEVPGTEWARRYGIEKGVLFT